MAGLKINSRIKPGVHRGPDMSNLHYMEYVLEISSIVGYKQISFRISV
jgi:hypothetical protein